MSRLQEQPTFARDMHPRADEVRANAYHFGTEEERGPDNPAATPGISEGLAATLAGVLVLGLGGLIAGAVISGGMGSGVGIGLAAGVAAGLIIGRRIASFEHVWSGALVTGLLPLLLCFKDAIRRGRLNMNELARPEALTVMGAIFGAGAVLGGLLVATRKLIVWLGRHQALNG